MSLESQLFRQMKADSPQFARSRHPERDDISRLETAKRRCSTAERRNNFLEQTAALLEGTEQRDIEQEQITILRTTVFDLLPVLLKEYQEAEMHKNIFERLEASVLESVLFVEIPDSMEQKQKGEKTQAIRNRVHTLFSDKDCRKELEQRIEAYYESAAQNLVATHRQLAPGPISDAKAQEAFDELLQLASFHLIPVDHIEKRRQDILAQWHKEYYDIERNFRILEEELDVDSADELRSVLSIPHFRALLFRIKEYHVILQEETISPRTREAWGILVTHTIKSRLDVLIETRLSLPDETGDFYRRHDRMRRSSDELEAMSREQRQHYSQQMEELRRQIERIEQVSYLAENVFVTPRDILHQEIAEALVELGPEKIEEVWEQFLDKGRKLIRAWKIQHSTYASYQDRHSRGYFIDASGNASDQRMLTMDPPAWFTFFEPKQFYVKQIDMQDILTLPSAQPTHIPRSLQKQGEAPEKPPVSS